MERRPIIQRRPQEEIDAEARARHDDYEKVRTAAANSLTWGSIEVSSRYGKAQELDQMLDMLEAVPEKDRHLIKSIWCDSKANSCYSVELGDCDTAIGEEIVNLLEAASGGHNGIYVEGVPGVSSRDPHWPEAGEEIQDNVLDGETLEGFFAAADAVLEMAAEVITRRLKPMSDDHLSLIAERAAERHGAGPQLQFVRDIILEEIGRRQ